MKKLVLLAIFLSCFCSGFCQYPEIPYERISEQQGLYDHNIKCLLQDSKGFIWMGGENGLYRYDGYHIIYYKDPPGCENCPPFYPVHAIAEDNKGLIWTISFNGITLYDPERERSWMAYRFRGANPNSGSSFFYNLPLSLIKDLQGNIWASDNMGLIRISYKENSDKEILSDKGPESAFNIDYFQLSQNKNSYQNMVIKIYVDSEGNIWTGCIDGLYVLRKGDTSFYRIDIEAELKSSYGMHIKGILQQNKDTFLVLSRIAEYMMINVKKALHGPVPDGSALGFTKLVVAKGQTVSNLYKDQRGNVFFGTNTDVIKLKGTDKKGRFIFDSFYKKMFDKNELASSPQSIFVDRSGMLWTGLPTGVLKFNPERSPFTTYKNLSGITFTNLCIVPFHIDLKGNLWMAGWGDGLYKIQRENGIATRYDLGARGNEINSIEEIDPGIFWLGLGNAGVLEFDARTGKFHDPLPDGSPADILRKMQVNDILKDRNLLYISSDVGFFVYDRIKKRLVRFAFPNFAYFVSNWTVSPIRLKNGEIIVFTSLHGINKIMYDAEKGSLSLKSIITDSVLRKSNINLTHLCRLYQDSRGLLWMVEKTGLYRIDLEKGEIYNYRLFNNTDFPDAWSIIEDNHRNLWIGTNFGLCRFTISTGQVKNFTKEDGVPFSIHQYNTVCKDKDGRFYFGGNGGFYSFHPDSIKTNTYVPSVVITDFRLFKKSVPVDTTKKSILTKKISYTSLIELHHDQNDLSFEFAALDFTMPLRNQYAYKLEGYQGEWIETDANNRLATYTNLDPGKYTFRVRGSNNDGVWNLEGASITIIIHKPWWETNLAWCMYSLMFLGLIGGYIQLRLRQLKKEKLKLENQVSERTRQIENQKNLLEQQNQQITEQEQLKSRFFTNVSHEFRTPLSLIQSPVEELLDDPRRNEKERRKLNMVQRNARRLLILVNQLLDISKIDGSKMKLELVEADVTKQLRAITGAFTSLAETKSIHYQCHFPAEKIISWFDPDKLEKIAGNILSNAFKFTPEGGEIIFAALYKNSNDPGISNILEFSVKDNGPGIPSDSLEKIFDRFYQVEASVKSEGGGTGIGLSLARDMAHLLHGDIHVESEPGKGSIFTVSIPLGIGHLEESGYIILKEIPVSAGSLVGIQENPEATMPYQEGMSTKEKPVILIVEDNRDIRLQLADNLNSAYTIAEAIDGFAGLKKATEMIPDLVITDLMMPRMDGIELCEKLKNDERTSHIPIIMLTAKVTLEDKVTGFLTGADDYVPKPFQMAELKARVANLIEQRRKLRERFSREVTLQPRDISITPLDEQFLNRAIEIVERHMDDEKFDNVALREEMNMTRSTLFRKLHALTNQSPTEFIRTIRVKRAADLLKQNFGNVTQVSLEVGFNNLSYFNRSFKKLFRVSPVEYVKKQS